MQAAATRYLTSDQLGSPRVVTDNNGAIVARHDYLAFGEELLAGTSGRTTAQGYGQPDNVRQKFTGYERDNESGLDYAQARYYNSKHGRFTSVDPLTASASIRNPQTFNRYSYALNSPYKFTDPLGLAPCGNSNPNGGNAGRECTQADDWDTAFGAESARAEADFDHRLGNTLDSAAANDALATGDRAAADAIVANNPNVEFVENRRALAIVIFRVNLLARRHSRVASVKRLLVHPEQLEISATERRKPARRRRTFTRRLELTTSP